jgi:hypothetical protein
MADVEWKPLPTPIYPEGSAMAALPGSIILAMSFEAGVPTWKVRRQMDENALPGLVADGMADSFTAAKTAASHVVEAELRS